MKYRELLKQCKDKPGCLSTNEQKEIETIMNYRSWVKKIDNKKKDSTGK